MKVTSYRPPETGDFAFPAETLAEAKGYIARYPEGRQASAVIWLLYLAQRQNGGWLSDAAIEYVAKLLDMAPIRVHEVASFYSMFNRKPVGRYLVQVCRTTSCWLRGSNDIVNACLEAAGTSTLGETSADSLFTVVEVECLGACSNAPLFQVNDGDYFEDLTPQRARAVLAALKEGAPLKPGSQSGRTASEPEGELTTLTELQGRSGA